MLRTVKAEPPRSEHSKILFDDIGAVMNHNIAPCWKVLREVQKL